MKTLALVLSLSTLVALSSPVRADDDTTSGGVAVEAKAFFTSVLGKYKILKAGGEAPHESGSIGTVERDTNPDQSIVTLTYCPPGAGCDPGFIFLEDSATQVTQSGNTWTIIHDDGGGKKSRYTWTQDGGNVTFRNYQYVMPNGSTVTLEHVMVKMPAEDEG